MRMLGYMHDPEECQRVRELLADRGIPTFLGASDQKYYVHPLFVCINQQFEDAVALLKDANHSVKEPADVAKFYRAASRSGLNEILRNGLVILCTLLLAAGLLVAFRFW